MRKPLRFLLPAFVALAVVIALTARDAARGAKPRQAERPNILVIMTDDQTAESLRVMRQVRGLLARQGTTFENSFASFPLCCPSRATFLTGQYAHNHHVLGNSFTLGYYQFNQSNTLPMWLQRAGYATIMVGKYLNGYGKLNPHYVPPGWTDWHGGVAMGYRDHSLNENGRLRYFAGRPQDYQTDVYRRTAIAAIRRFGPSPRPFFMWLSFFAPHRGQPRDLDDPVRPGTPSPAPRHRDRFASMPLPADPSFNEVDVADKPAIVRKREILNPEDILGAREAYQQRLESLLAVDEAVKAVVAELARQGELRRTLIIFTSDNGFLEGQHRLLALKQFLYEPSIRVPLIMRGPGVPRDRKRTQLVMNVDLAPTILAAARARPGLPQDGRSLFPLLRDRGLEWGRDVVLERGPTGLARPRLYTAVRTPRFVYAEHVTGERELYDLERDPYQMTSVHDDPAYASIEAELARRLGRERDCVGALCRRGPAVDLLVAFRGVCPNGVVKASVGGADRGQLEYVVFRLGSRRFRDAEAPFERELTQPAGARRLRALAVFADGRRATRDRVLPSCA
jgi:arylsulfatase A-like enzyme